MVRSTPERRHLIRVFSALLSTGLLTLAPGALRAQQNTAHPAPVTTHPNVPRSAPIMARPVMQPHVPRTARPGAWPSGSGRFSTARRVYSGPSTPPQGQARQFSRAFLSRPFFLGGAFVGFGRDGSFSRPSNLPLGFGLWPACDSAGVPSVFWSVGPCFGIGDYSAESAAANAYPPGTAPPSGYLLPLFFGEEPPPASAAPSANAPAPVSTAVLYRTNGTAITASDWWVAHGRLQYISDSGSAGSMDLSQLDLEQTITQNETRGLEFHLRFTAPADRL